MHVVPGFEVVTLVEGASFEPFAAPACVEFQALDAGAIQATNLIAWAASLDHPLAMQIHELSSVTIGEFMMEALASQAIMSLPVPRWERVMPRDCLGRIITFEMQPQRHPDPPVPLLFMTGLARNVQAGYNLAVRDMVAGDGAAMRRALPTVMADAVGTLTRSEVFYLLARIQSLATGAYRQRYDTANVLPASER